MLLLFLLASVQFSIAITNPAQKTLFLYYDYLTSDNGQARDASYNTQLVTGVESEVAFGGNNGNEPVSFAGSSTSIRLCPVLNSDCGSNDLFTTDNVLRYLANYTYVHVDEMRSDQEKCSEDCATVVREVAAAGLGGRIIFYFRFGPTDVAGVATQSALLQTAKEGLLRKIFFEVYKDGWITTTNVAQAKNLLSQWSSTYAQAFSGSNLYIAPAIGVSNWKASGAYLNCCSQDMSALSTIYSDMHSTQADWKGASFYLASKVSDCWSNGCTTEPVGTGTRVYTRQTVVNKLNGLNAWWNGKASTIIVPSTNSSSALLPKPRVLGSPAQNPLAFYYDYFNGRDPSTNSLATPSGVEVAFGGNCGNDPTPVWIPSSGSYSATSFRLKPADTCTCAEECVSFDNIMNAFGKFPYVHIDEISNDHPCPECAGVIQQVGDAGYGGRIIAFFRYSQSGIGLSDQFAVIDLAVRGYMRKIFFEAYPSSHDQCSSYVCTSTSSSACNKLNTWAVDINNVYGNANQVFAPAFGLRSGLDLDVCSQDLGALTSYFSCMHQYQGDWKGAAWFGASSCSSCSSYSYNDVAQKCASLVSWWG